jgi:hypothetical protein
MAYGITAEWAIGGENRFIMAAEAERFSFSPRGYAGFFSQSP